MKQVKHFRTYWKGPHRGQKFPAGSRSPEVLEEREVNILDTYEDYEPSDTEIKEISERTGIGDKELIKNLLVENDGDIGEVIEQLEEEFSDEDTDDEED